MQTLRHSLHTYVVSRMANELIAWSRRQLRAAFWVGHVLGASGASDEVAHASWIDLPLAGEVDLQELQAAERALLATGLVRRDGGYLRCDDRLRAACEQWQPEVEELLLSLLLEAAGPLWLRTAGGGDKFAAELIPEDAATALAIVIPDPARREAFLLARARTVDARERQQLGARAEEIVVAACRAELVAHSRHDYAARVRRVSLISDELGYDVVSPRLDGTVRRLEVKATRSAPTTVAVTVTRNELAVGLADPDWFLVVVHVGYEDTNLDGSADSGGTDDGHVVGHVTSAALEALLPQDRHGRGQWQTARLRLAFDVLVPGLPPASRPSRRMLSYL